MSDLDKIQALREKTGLGIMDLKQALHDAAGDEHKALEALKVKGVLIAEKRAGRTTGQGIVSAYVHSGRIGALVELQCETDFVAKTDDFKELARDIAMQVASMDPSNREDLLNQEYIKDSAKTIQDLLTEVIAKTGENIQIGSFSRIGLGQSENL